jgi:hypothetical protein
MIMDQFSRKQLAAQIKSYAFFAAVLFMLLCVSQYILCFSGVGVARAKDSRGNPSKENSPTGVFAAGRGQGWVLPAFTRAIQCHCASSWFDPL